ncbi:Chromate resistance protein ChrB [Streptomyces sp. NPDC058299]|uniref:Chromate resistance protein ChrB n=1 Tax=unclassified Streptomyces TaxID=2593676 RepID=UPI0036ED7908
MWRRLKALGAIHVQNAVAALPADDENEEIADRCRDFLAEIEKETAASHFTYGEREENDEDLTELRGRPTRWAVPAPRALPGCLPLRPAGGTGIRVQEAVRCRLADAMDSRATPERLVLRP